MNFLLKLIALLITSVAHIHLCHFVLILPLLHMPFVHMWLVPVQSDFEDEDSNVPKLLLDRSKPLPYNFITSSKNDGSI